MIFMHVYIILEECSHWQGLPVL